MKILLTSAGIQAKEEVFKFIATPPKETKIAHIITAAKVEKDRGYMIREKKTLIENGFFVEDIDIEGKTENELKKSLSDKTVIYVQGGNTFYLLKCINESGFGNIVKVFLNRGGLYIGISAGSYVACPTIEQATWKHQDREHFELTDLTGLNLVPFLVSAHFQESYRPLIEAGANESKLPTVALYDTQAVLVEDGKWKIVGKGKKEFFNGFKENL